MILIMKIILQLLERCTVAQYMQSFVYIVQARSLKASRFQINGCRHVYVMQTNLFVSLTLTLFHAAKLPSRFQVFIISSIYIQHIYFNVYLFIFNVQIINDLISYHCFWLTVCTCLPIYLCI